MGQNGELGFLRFALHDFLLSGRYICDMDKNNKTGIPLTQEAPHNLEMSEETADALFAQATDLAHQAFPGASDGHVECVYARLIVNHAYGAGAAGAVTVH